MNSFAASCFVPAVGTERYQAPGTPAMPPGPPIIGAAPMLPLTVRVLRGLRVGVTPEPHHRELALVEEVLRTGPVELRRARGGVRQQARVEVERLEVLGAVDRDLTGLGVEHHLLLARLRHGREPLGLDRTLHVGAVQVDLRRRRRCRG